jgi:hypothetical protein
MLGTRLIIRFATAKRWRRALDSEWATGSGVVSSKMPFSLESSVQLRIFVGSTPLDLAARVQNVLSLADDEHHVTLAVRWSDSKRLLAESLTHGHSDVGAGPDEFPPVAVAVVTESVPPFVHDRSAQGILQAEPGRLADSHTSSPHLLPPRASASDFANVLDTDVTFSPVDPLPGSETERLPCCEQQTPAEAATRSVYEESPSPASRVPKSAAKTVAEHYPVRVSRALELLAQAKLAESRGELREARRRAALAQAFDPVEPRVKAYLEMLRRRTDG